MYTFEIYRDWHGDYKWRLMSSTGRVVAVSGDNFPSEAIAKGVIKTLQQNMAGAAVQVSQRAA